MSLFPLHLGKGKDQFCILIITDSFNFIILKYIFKVDKWGEILSKTWPFISSKISSFKRLFLLCCLLQHYWCSQHTYIFCLHLPYSTLLFHFSQVLNQTKLVCCNNTFVWNHKIITSHMLMSAAQVSHSLHVPPGNSFKEKTFKKQ